QSKEGFIHVRGGRIYYLIHGKSSKAPLLLLHGGPGFPHNGLLPLSDLCNDRGVIFYDQLGCGRSDRPQHDKHWTIAHFVEEISILRRQLEIDKLHLFGHSWGALLAIEYLLSETEGVLSATLSSPAIDIPAWVKDSLRLRAELPPEMQLALQEGEKTGDFYSANYLAAQSEYYRRHICRIHPLPPELTAAGNASGPEVYNKMWGPNEFTLTGSLAEVNQGPAIAEISIPLLFTCGRYDEATPETTHALYENAQNAEIEIFEHSSHSAHFEEREAYVKRLRKFLAHAEGGSKSLWQKLLGVGARS
ncbi:UNVERIFIED_CONTAM: hypothetical protein GTU68_005894, partial [Idotea baltica]|nr:hypothetical protein [Idotea baltica]